MELSKAWTVCWMVSALIVGCEEGPEPDFQPEPVRAERAGEGESAGNEADRAAEGAGASKGETKLTKRPTSPDPEKGEFTLAEAVEGLGGAPAGDLVAHIETGMGDLECALYDERAPVTVANFVGLARGTRPWWDARAAEWVRRPYYDGTTFHRVVPNFMIQGGDYLGSGRGEVGYHIPDEVHPELKHDAPGLLCMANKGADTNSAQFFITDGPAPHLDGGYTIFGKCTPTEVVSKIARVPQSGAPANRALDPVEMERVRIRRE